MSEKEMLQRRSSDEALAMIDRREAQLRKKAKTPGEIRECRSVAAMEWDCLLYTSPSPRDGLLSRMPSSA